MKKLLLIILFSLISTFSQAQLRGGLKFNCTINKLMFKSTNEDVEFMKGALVEFGYNGLSGGAVVNYKLNQRFSIQSELIFDAFKTNFAKMEYYTNWKGERWAVGNGFNIRMNYLEIPCMAKISFGGDVTFDLFAGAFAGYLISAKQSTENGALIMPSDTTYIPGDDPEPKIIDYPKQSVRSDYTSFNGGVLVGFGITMHDRVTLEIRLNRGLINISKADFVKTNTLQGQFTVGWYIFRQKEKTSL